MQKRPKTSSPFCQNKCSFFIVNLNIAKNILFEVCGRFNSMITFCRFAMGGLFTTKVDAEHKTFGYHKTVCIARNPAYCKCAVISRYFCCHGIRNMSISNLLSCRQRNQPVKGFLHFPMKLWQGSPSFGLFSSL